MPKSLTEAQIAAYEREGYLAPVPVMGEAEVRAARQARGDRSRHGRAAAR
jgi:hypothetical protein